MIVRKPVEVKASEWKLASVARAEYSTRSHFRDPASDPFFAIRVGMKIRGLDSGESLSKAKRVASSASVNTSDLRGIIDLLVKILELLVGVIG